MFEKFFVQFYVFFAPVSGSQKTDFIFKWQTLLVLNVKEKQKYVFVFDKSLFFPSPI